MNSFDRYANIFQWKLKQLAFTLALAFVLVSVVSVCKAYTPDPNTWTYVTYAKENGSSYYLNTNDLNKCMLNYKKIKNIPSLVYAQKYQIWELTLKKTGAHTLTYTEYDLNPQNKRSRLLSIVEYDKDQNLVNSTDVSYPVWQKAVPGTIGEALYETVEWWITS